MRNEGIVCLPQVYILWLVNWVWFTALAFGSAYILRILQWWFDMYKVCRKSKQTCRRKKQDTQSMTVL
jgi:hypothetical protein